VEFELPEPVTDVPKSEDDKQVKDGIRWKGILRNKYLSFMKLMLAK
jgi:hypothetical protein